MEILRNKRGFVLALGVLILIPVFVLGGFGMYGLSQADKLPWQTPATRIPITPVEMPSFGTIGGTPAPELLAEATPAS